MTESLTPDQVQALAHITSLSRSVTEQMILLGYYVDRHGLTRADERAVLAVILTPHLSPERTGWRNTLTGLAVTAFLMGVGTVVGVAAAVTAVAWFV